MKKGPLLCFAFDTELLGLRVRIEAAACLVTTLPRITFVKAYWPSAEILPNGKEIAWENLLGLYAAEHDLNDHDAAATALAEDVYGRAQVGPLRISMDARKRSLSR